MIKKEFKNHLMSRNKSKGKLQYAVFNKSKEKKAVKTQFQISKENINSKNIKSNDQIMIKATNQSKSPEFKYKNKINRIEPNTPKQLQNQLRQINFQDFDQLSQIKYESKQCSSIKQNQIDIDCIAAVFLDQNIDSSFSNFSLKDRDDLKIQLEGAPNVQNSVKKIGKIKRNNHILQSNTFSNHKCKKYQEQIQLIFNNLDANRSGLLNKENCLTECLSTQLCYIIGSLLNKIKILKKTYNLKQFKEQFSIMIEEVEEEQLDQIIFKNQQKRKNYFESEEPILKSEREGLKDQFLKEKQSNQPLSPCFKDNFCSKFVKKQIDKSPNQDISQLVVTQRLNRINSKLDQYFFKKCGKKNVSQSVAKIHQRYLQNENQIKEVINNNYIAQQCFSSNQGKRKNDLGSMEAKSNQIGSKINRSIQYKPFLFQKKDVEVIKGYDGTVFELNFSILNQHS